METYARNLNAVRVPPTPDPKMLALGRAVRAAREDRDLTQERLADESGATANYIGMVERGETNVTLSRLSQIADVLDVKASVLMKRAGL